jgi:DNA polymerase (family 10)
MRTAIANGTKNAASNAATAGSAPRAPVNAAVADAFDEMAELLAIRGESPFRVRAYQRAASVVRSQPYALAELRATMAFDELPGIGPELAAKLDEFLASGKLRALELLRRQVPSGLRDLLRLPALGPVRVRALYAKLAVRNPEDLRAALAAGRVETLRGFGPAIVARLHAALDGTRD